jgi:methionyl-tRNA formyltransferase
MKITLYLMTQKGFEVLKALIDNNFNSLISHIVVGRDRNIENDFYNEIITICNQNNIIYKTRSEVYQVTSDFSIAISWRWLISNNNSQIIVFHDSLLPKYRGFAPLVNMLCNKEKEIGVTAILASEEYDKGDIIAQSSTKICYPIKVSDAIDLISKNYVDLVIKIFNDIANGDKIIATPQDEKLATYSLWRDEEDYIINWLKDSDQILNFINAVSSPFKGAVAYIDGLYKIRVLEAELENDVEIVNRDVGKVIFVKNKFPVIVCGSGLIKLLKVVDDRTQENLLPFKNFRVRLTYSNKINDKLSIQ